MKVRYAGNKFDQKQLYSAIKCVTQNWWALGDKGVQFQQEFCKVIGKPYGVFVNSGSSANLLAIYYAKKLGYKKVITPVCGFPTTINAILQLGLQPLFIDIDDKTLNLNLNQLEVMAKTHPGSVLMFAHALGNPPNMDQVMKIVEQYNLYLIEDCCDALGSTYNAQQDVIIDSNGIRRRCVDIKLSGDNWGDAKFSMDIIKERVDKKLGTFGKLSTYSFYPAHHMTTGQGGFIATDDYEVYKTLVSFRDWGRACTCRGKQDAMKQNGRCGRRFGKWLSGLPELEWDHKYCYSQIGFNLKPLELQAVIGLQQIKKLPEFESIRAYNYLRLRKVFDKYPQYFELPLMQQYANVNWFCFPVSIKYCSPFKRTDIIQFLQNSGIETRLYFGGNVLYHEAYKDFVQENYNGDYNRIHKLFPNAKYVTQNTFFLGVSQVITEQQINYVCKKIEEFMEKH